MHQRKRHSHFSRLELSFRQEGEEEDREAVVDIDDQAVSFRSAAFSEAQDPADPGVLSESLDIEGKRVDLPTDSDGQVLLAPIRGAEPAADAADGDPSLVELAAATVSESTNDDALSVRLVSSSRGGFGFLRAEMPEQAAKPGASVLFEVHVDPAYAQDERCCDVHAHDDVGDDAIPPRISRSTAWPHPTEMADVVPKNRGTSPPPEKIAFGKALGSGCKAVGAGSAKAFNATVGVIGHGARTSASAVHRSVTAALVRICRSLNAWMPRLKSAVMAVLNVIRRAGPALSSHLARILTATAAGIGQAGSALSSRLGMGLRSSAVNFHQVRLGCLSRWRSAVAALYNLLGQARRSAFFGGFGANRAFGAIGRRQGFKAGFGTAMHIVPEVVKQARSKAANIVPASIVAANVIPLGAAIVCSAVRPIIHYVGAALTSNFGGPKRHLLVGLAAGSACIFLLAIAWGHAPRLVPPYVMLPIPEKPLRDKPISFASPSIETTLQTQADQPSIQEPEKPQETSIPDLAAIGPVPLRLADKPLSGDPEAAEEVVGTDNPAFLLPEEALARLIEAVASGDGLAPSNLLAEPPIPALRSTGLPAEADRG